MEKDLQYGPKSEEHKNRFAAINKPKAENAGNGAKAQNIEKNKATAR